VYWLHFSFAALSRFCLVNNLFCAFVLQTSFSILTETELVAVV